MDFYNIKIKDRSGSEVSLEQYKGKVLLIVNTATKCGFTPQYDGLQKLYEEYKDSGFEILDFPCNQFANQAPGSDEEIHEFCTSNYNINFTQFSKIDVNGENESELYTFLKTKKRSLLGRDIKWNFTKFLINKNGKVIDRFSPNTKPEKIKNAIEKLLSD